MSEIVWMMITMVIKDIMSIEIKKKKKNHLEKDAGMSMFAG